MLSFFISCIQAAAQDTTLSASGVTNPSILPDSLSPYYTIFLIIDILFLLYVVFSRNNKFNEYTTFLLLVHGSTPIIAELFKRLQLTNPYAFIAVFIMTIILYYFLCEFPLFIQVITVINCSLLSAIVLNSLLGQSTGSLVATGTGFLIAVGIFVFLGITRFEILYKIHTMFVLYLVITILIETITGISVYSSAGKDVTSLSLNLLIGLVVAGALVFILFFN